MGGMTTLVQSASSNPTIEMSSGTVTSWTSSTMVVVTHEMNFARKVADQVVFMDEGEIVEAGHPQQLFDNPQNRRLRRFLSEVL
jgi:ABC-type polar amino acid transport system ATPase subunit